MEARLSGAAARAAARAGILDRFGAVFLKSDLWVFGYGSLMWHPGFAYASKQHAVLYGYHRSLCIYSTRHRGTAGHPGLVMGLAPGGSCHGMAFLVERPRVADTLIALWRREMRVHTYQPRHVSIRIARRPVRALAFVANIAHRHYAGELAVEEVARRVIRSHGQRGPNVEYVLNTAAHLDALGVADRRLARVLAAIRDLRAA